MTTRNDGVFDEEEALNELISKYGVDETKNESENEKKRKNIEGEETNESKSDMDDGEDKPTKKTKKSHYACEDNREIGEAIMEMAGIYFKNSDARKGGVFSKAGKAIRECDFKITNKKEAMSLKGIGKGIAGYIEEYIENRMIVRLEEMRAGQA